jgi:hypothetical protein
MELFFADSRGFGDRYCELNVKSTDFEMLGATRAWLERRQKGKESDTGC